MFEHIRDIVNSGVLRNQNLLFEACDSLYEKADYCRQNYMHNLVPAVERLENHRTSVFSSDPGV